MQEAKYDIFRDCLGFKDFKNFDGVRFSYKGIRIVTFKLKEQIDVDELIGKQFFSYKRRFKRNGKLENVEIKCKIRGLRSNALKEKIARKQAERVDDNGTMLIRISGCEYKIAADKLKECLEYWGELKSDPKEEVFEDPMDNVHLIIRE